MVRRPKNDRIAWHGLVPNGGGDAIASKCVGSEGENNMTEHFDHENCPECGAKSVPAENVPDQALRGCPECMIVWFEGSQQTEATNGMGS